MKRRRLGEINVGRGSGRDLQQRLRWFYRDVFEDQILDVEPMQETRCYQDGKCHRMPFEQGG